MFTENETNFSKIDAGVAKTPFTKDAFYEAIVNGVNMAKLRSKKVGTKFSPVYELVLEPGETQTIYCRLISNESADPFTAGFENIFTARRQEADDFYNAILPSDISADLRNIQRKALSGLLWSKQYYHFDVERWLNSSDGITPVNEAKKNGRNKDWTHLKNQDIIAMPDKWEYPFYARGTWHFIVYRWLW